MVEEARLPERVRKRALATFQALATAEGRIHRRPPEQVHFHEVGALDAIVDIVGTAAALEVLDVARRVRIDLVVIDLDSEPGLVDEIRSSQPDLRLLYVSDRSDEQPADSEHNPPLLTPFSLDELRVAIAGLLGRSESEATDGGGTAP